MNLYECPRIDDAAGYVLRALPDYDADTYREHVMQCPECAEKVAELGFVSNAMLSAVPQLSAPPDIRDRVMAVVRAEAELLQAAGAGADRPPRVAKQRRFGLQWISLRPLAAGAVASVLLAVGLGVGTLLNSSEAPCSTRGVTTVAPAAGDGASADLKVCSGGSAKMVLASLRPPAVGQTYQLWVDHANDRLGPQSAGTFAVEDRRATVNVADLRHGDTVLVTREPRPGSEIPTMQPLIKVAT